MKKRILPFILLIFALSLIPCFAASNTVHITGTHEVSNMPSLTSTQFSFVLTAKGHAPMPDGTPGLEKTVTTSANSAFDFGTITYPEDGAFRYTLTRNITPSETLEQDDSVYNIVVTVTNGEASMIIGKEGTTEKFDKIEYKDKYLQDCSVKFILNGGSLDGTYNPKILTANIGDVIIIPKGPYKEGYKFLYWQGSKYYPGDRYVVEGDHTFTAIYEPIGKTDQDTDKKIADNDSEKNSNNNTDKSKEENRGVKTGDTPIAPYVTLFASAIAILVSRKYVNKSK